MNELNLANQLSKLSAYEAAYRLIGCDLIRIYDNTLLVGKIVETEAYDQSDKFSHSYKGITNRNSVMFGEAGKAYIYFTYGMHYCMNIVVGMQGIGSAVLIRAIEPIEGIKLMQKNRNTLNKLNLTNGPAKLTQAFAIDKSLNGHDLNDKPLMIKLNKTVSNRKIQWSHRIGLKEEKDQCLQWRACLRDSNFLSHKL